MAQETVSGREDRRRATRQVAAIALLSLLAKILVLALVFPAKPGILLSPDTMTYERPAIALLASGSFSPSPEAVPAPELNRTPGFPLLIAAVYAVAGPRPLAVALLNVLLSTGTVALAGALGYVLAGRRAAILAAALLALDPGSFHYSLVVLTETPFAFLVALATLLLALAAQRPERAVGLAAASGLALALATHVRPVTYFYPAVGALLILLVVKPPRRSAAFAAYLAPVLLLVGGWQARNLARAGTASFTLNQQIELYLMRAAAAQALAEGKPVVEVQRRFGWDEYLFRFGYVATEAGAFPDVPYARLYPVTSKLSLPDLARLYERRAIEVLRAHPVAAALVQSRGLAFLFLMPATFLWQYQWGGLVPDEALARAYFYPRPFETLGWLATNAPAAFALALAAIALLAAVAALALRGGLRAWRSPAGAVVLATLAYLALVTAGPSCIDDRYRVPLAPFLAVLAARGLARREPA